MRRPTRSGFSVVLPGSEPSGAPKVSGYVQIPQKYGNPDRSGLTLEVAEVGHTFDINLRP
jgi:hypothetical protein